MSDGTEKAALGYEHTLVSFIYVFPVVHQQFALILNMNYIIFYLHYICDLNSV